MISSAAAVGATRTSIAIVGAMGLQTGWWGERWDLAPGGEINIRYEITPGSGVVFIAGLGKALYTERSAEEIYDESQIRGQSSEFKERTEITRASEGGTFKQLPVGAGFYYEGLMGGMRPYVSLAAAVYLWQFERNQDFSARVQVPEAESGSYIINDNWRDEQDGADLGGQAAIGLLYPLKKLLFLDVSAAYHVVNISRKYGALAYWGRPARTYSGDQLSGASGGADYVQVRVGIRYGR